MNGVGLHEPRRNKYFYGKLLDVAHMQLEQCYGIDKRRLLNRLALGPGVLCGLSVTAGTNGKVVLSPGVAIDRYGREIVVTAPASIDPAQLTDAHGCPCGDPIDDGYTTIYLCYTECDTELTDVYVSECDGVPNKAPSTTLEKYRVLVRAGQPSEQPAALTPEQREAIFPEEPPEDFDRRIAAEEALAITCPCPPDMSCVVLATVALPDDGQPMLIDQYTYRAEVFSNTVLFQLIAALADRVDACCAAMNTAPVVEDFYPPNAIQLEHEWADDPTIDVTFSHDMDPDGLEDPHPWLRAWVFQRNEDETLESGKQITLTADEVGLTTRYTSDVIEVGRPLVIVVMKGSNEIVGAGSGLALDSGYRGTNLEIAQLDQLWDSDEFEPDAAFSAAVTDTGNGLPSGDDTAGGYFHAYFKVDPAP